MKKILILLFLLTTPVSAAVVAPNGAKEIENYVTSWIGNTYGGLNPQTGKAQWVQQDIAGICVTPDGTVYTNVPWEEAGGNCSMYKDGVMLGAAMHTHGWGALGGKAVAVNDKYVYIAMEFHNEGGNLVDPGTWPDKGKRWFGVSRRLLSDFTQPAPFEGGKGGKGDTLEKSFLVVNEVQEGQTAEQQAGITGLWADNERLYVSNPHTNCVEIHDAETMRKLDSWDFTEKKILNPGQIAADKHGNIWVAHQLITDSFKDYANEISRFDSRGNRFEIFLSDDGTPENFGSFCFGPNNELYAFNSSGAIMVIENIDQWIDNAQKHRIEDMDERAASTSPSALIGFPLRLQNRLFPKIYPFGEFGDLRFLKKVSAIGCDTAGRLYIVQDLASNGGGAILECVQLTQKPKRKISDREILDAEILWRLSGLCFLDCATLDPDDENIVWTKEEKFHIDWSKEPGKEWSLNSLTLYPTMIPEDPYYDLRPRLKDTAGVWARNIRGNKYLFVNDMNARFLQVYKAKSVPENIEYSTEKGKVTEEEYVDALRENGYDAETIAQFQQGHKRADEFLWFVSFFGNKNAQFGRGFPSTPKTEGAWIWTDLNYDKENHKEIYSRPQNGQDEPSAQGWWVDTNGDVWRVTETEGIRRFPIRPESGELYSYDTMVEYPHPAEFTAVKRIRYDAATDTLYLGGCTEEHKNQHWKPMGPVVCRYDHFLHGDGKLAWKIVLPYVTGSSGHESCEPMGFDVAGDYLFVPYTGASKETGFKTGHVEVYRVSDGQSVGWMEPDPKTVGEVGLMDLRECISAHRRQNGEYVIFLEDDYKAKVIMYRWKGKGGKG